MKESTDEDKLKIKICLIISVGFTALLWFVWIFQLLTKLDLVTLGVYPRTIAGLKGILFSPLVNSGFSHLFSNAVPVFILTFFMFYFYSRSAVRVFLIIYFVHGILVWLFAREAYHIGTSGIVYGLVAFIFFIGVLRRDAKSIGVSLIVVFLYGSIAWGVLPIDPRISFEAHAFGAITGLICAIAFKNTDPYPPKYEWEDEEEKEEESTDENDTFAVGQILSIPLDAKLPDTKTTNDKTN